MKALRNFIRELLLREKKDDDASSEKKDYENLLVEPDEVDEPGQEEVNVVANIAGVSTPLGTGPTYPAGKRKKKKISLPAGWQKAQTPQD
ncbi:MAG: hypothetical protein CMB80_09320 [Flammeovirgaceae bacterium]|nr:hypothetical protein [Flammeovirgaceae bacterium]